MNIFSCNKNKFKIFGITVFNLKNRSNGVYIHILGIPCCKYNHELFNISEEFKANKKFNTKEFDNRIKAVISPFHHIEYKKDNKKIGYLATELYDMGGHTKCIRDLLLSLRNHYQQSLFLTQKTTSFIYAPNILNVIKKHANIYGEDTGLLFFKKNVKKFCNKIISSKIKTLLVYIHPNDVFGTAVLAYLKNTTDIKIIYFNHASHFPSLGMSFTDLILEGMPSTEKVTNEKRGFFNTKIIGLQSLAKEDTQYFSKEEIKSLKDELGIPENKFITMSGGAAYKFFDKNSSPYFQLIKNLLQQEPELVHVIITEFDNKQKSVIEDIFEDEAKLKERLLIVPYQTNFDKYFQMADVFIDSFPVSSALTQIDLMRNKVASVVKINKENTEYSFHEYQMLDYPYMFENVEDMEKAVLELLHNKGKRKDIIEKNYAFWLKTYESSVKRDEIINIIERF